MAIWFCSERSDLRKIKGERLIIINIHLITFIALLHEYSLYKRIYIMKIFSRKNLVRQKINEEKKIT